MPHQKLTQKQENFVLDVFADVTPSKAYLTHYRCKPSAAYALASRLLTNAKIQVRLQALRKAAEDASVASVLERKQVLTEIIRGRFVDFMANLTPEKLRSAALQEIRIMELGEGKKTTTIKLNNPVQAINELNKMEKIYAEGATVNIDNRSINVIVQSKKAKELTERIAEGQGTGN